MKLGTFRLARRGRRPLFASAEVARLLRPKPAPTADLGALLEMIWHKHAGRLWTVAELRSHGYVEPAACRGVGYLLSSAVRAGGVVGRFRLHRDGQDRDGAIYRLEVVTCGDSADAARKTRASTFPRPR